MRRLVFCAVCVVLAIVTLPRVAECAASHQQDTNALDSVEGSQRCAYRFHCLDGEDTQKKAFLERVRAASLALRIYADCTTTRAPYGDTAHKERCTELALSVIS